MSLVVLYTTASAWGNSVPSPVWLLSGPGQPETGDRPCLFWLQCLNPSSAPVAVDFSNSLSCHWQSAGRERKGQLTLLANDEAGSISIPAGGFVRRAYKGNVPEGLTGRMIVTLATLQASPAVVEVTEPATPERGLQAKDTPAKDTVLPLEKPKPTTNPYAFFRTHFFPHEPFYFIYGPESPNVKFQVSLKYKILTAESSLIQYVPPLQDLYLGYSQTSLWDLDKPSSPFFDSSYRPEFLYFRTNLIDWEKALHFKLHLQTGFQHESNGRDGSETRSLNIAYLKPSISFGPDTGLKFTVAPRVWTYVGDLDENPDIINYRGYADLITTLNWRQSVQLAAWLRAGKTFNHGSLQLDLTVPLAQIPFLRSSLYFQAQYFTGYGESLLRYNERENHYRFGLGIFQ